MPIQLRPFWLESGSGRLSVTSWWPAQAQASSTVIIVPPFAEEMNKCRRMLALQAQALAAAGVVAVHPDLYGTGDSEGCFADARWSDWLANIADVVKWARIQVGETINLLAVRSGALLGLEALALIGVPPRRTVLWAPTPSGKTFLTQFLRVQIAADLSTPPGERRGTAALWKQLENGETIEIAGYRLPSQVALALRDCDLEALLNAAPCPVTWFDVQADGSTVGAATQRTIDAIARAGRPAQFRTFQGEQFWATPEIAVVPELVARTVDAFLERVDALGH